MKETKLHMIGNAHLDPVWLWNWQEGYQEAKATFRSALDRMQEDPEFIFTCGATICYEWVEKNNPAMFEEIRQRVKEGRWQLVGGWIVQSDCNLPCGEAFARQSLYGQQYFLSRFGKAAKTGYNVDSFGHCAALPQILQQSGMENYVFMRPMPHEKALPGRLFWWKSPDGARVLTYQIPFEYCSQAGELENYVGRLQGELAHPHQELMLFYGVGNHGGGPTRENLHSIHQMQNREDLPALELSSPDRYFERIRQSTAAELPEVCGDLQHHASGCYSVMSRIKKQNRQAEQMLIAAEKWSAVAAGLKLQPYPDGEIKRAWKSILFNQFHDILAGTCIPSAYDDASYLYGEAMAIAQRCQNDALQAIAWEIAIEEEAEMKPIVVFNPHEWACRVPVELEVRGLQNDRFILTDPAGKPVAAQRIRSEATVLGQSRLLFVAQLPPMGYRVFKLWLNKAPDGGQPSVTMNETAAENDFWRLEWNAETGCLARIWDIKRQIDLLGSRNARMAVIQDDSDTWSHSVFKFDRELGYMTPYKVQVIERGPVRSVLRVCSRFHDSSAVQEYAVYRELPGIEVRVKLDWHEPQTMLKLKYPVNIGLSTATYEIPFGTIQKSANGEEEPGQSWIDYSGIHPAGGALCGLAIANDAKYSYSFEKQEMAVTLLKNSVYAHHEPKELDPAQEYAYTDEGIQRFQYLLLPHDGDWRRSDILRQSRQLLARPVTILETFHQGSLPQEFSFVAGSSASVLISAVKRAEDGEGYILRAYESEGTAQRVELQLPFLKRTIEAAFTPYQIQTLYVPDDSTQPVQTVNFIEKARQEQ